MKWWLKKEMCTGCAACYNVCPTKSIDMRYDKEGFLYPEFDLKKCVECGKCKEVCPVIKPQNNIKQNRTYACYRKDFEKRMQSSSGGIFAILAEKIISEKGLVCGASYSNHMEVVHSFADNIENLQQLKGSKYVQSDIGNSYKRIKVELKSGRKVLFSGTPCQVAGLKNFLGTDYENLICIDLICHGVPSPKVFESYIKENYGDKELVNINFRNKKNGMKNTYLEYCFHDGSSLFEKYDESPYIKGFIQNLYLRPSCYECGFKKDNLYSDITLGDFWGLEHEYPEFGDVYGISAAVIHTSRGVEYFNKISDECVFLEVNEEIVGKHNQSFLSSSHLNKKRKQFYNSYGKTTVKELNEKLYDPEYWYKSQVGYVDRIKAKIINIIRK